MQKGISATGEPHRRMIGVSLGVESTAEAEGALREIARSADIAEVRLDFMAEYDLPRLLENRPCPVIVANRPEREGGRFRGSEGERVGPLLEAIELGADYVDIEHDATHLIEDRKKTRLLVSYHDFQQVPANLVEIYHDLADKGADVVKIVGMARSLLDNVHLLSLLAQAEQPTVAIAMGKAGLLSRVLALRYDTCFVTYATLGQGETVAPGQLPITTMRDVYHAERIGPQTAIYGVLSTESVAGQMLSWLNGGMREAGLDGVWVPFEASVGDNGSPADVLRAYRTLDVAGYIVDESAQELVRRALDDIESARPKDRIMVVREIGGRLTGRWAAELREAFLLVTGREVTIEA